MVQGLRLHTPNAGGLGSIPGQGTRSHRLQLQIPLTTTEIKDPTCHTMARCSQINKIRGGEGGAHAPLCSQQPRHGRRPWTGGWAKRMRALYTVAYYPAIKKNGLMPFAATWIKLENIILSEGSQKRKLERQITHNITYTWNLKYDTNEQLQNKKSHSYRGQTGGCQGRGGLWGKGRESASSKCRHTGWMNKVLLYIKGN